MKLGLFAGTFDPIHEGHIAFAKAAIEELGLDKVLLMPEPRPRGKQTITALEQRVAMVELAIADDAKLDCFVHDVPQFTLENTVPVVHEQLASAELYILLGADVFASVPNWPNLEQYKAKITFVVGRGAVASPEASGLRATFIKHTQDLQSSSKVRSGASAPLPHLLGYIAENKLYQLPT